MRKSYQSKRYKSKPKPRQRVGDYRLFVGAFPTGDIADQIQTIRKKYDLKTATITDPHVTLAGTYWRSGPATPANEARLIEHLQRVISGKMPTFDLTLGGIRTFGKRVVYLGVKPTAPLKNVRQKLLNAIGQDKHRLWTPHLTLAMRLNTADTEAMIAELQETQWEEERFTVPIRALQLMQRAAHDPSWRVIGHYPLNCE